jgi:hypothetical protein
MDDGWNVGGSASTADGGGESAEMKEVPRLTVASSGRMKRIVVLKIDSIGGYFGPYHVTLRENSLVRSNPRNFREEICFFS